MGPVCTSVYLCVPLCTCVYLLCLISQSPVSADADWMTAFQSQWLATGAVLAAQEVGNGIRAAETH